MLPHQHVFEDDVCPVRDELLGELYSASKVGLPVLIATVTPDLRAQLALSEDLSYVMQLNESLVDLTGGQSALTALGNNFFAQVTPPKPGVPPKL